MSNQLPCASCGAPLPSRNPGIRRQVCEYCGGVNVWDAQGHRDSGKKSMLPEGFTRLYWGATGAIRGTRFEVLGRVRYGFGTGFWDEWYLLLDNGEYAWLSEDDHQLSLEQRTNARLTSALSVGSRVDVDGTTYTILEVGETVCLGIDGQVPADILPDERYRYADGGSGDGKLTIGIEYDDQPPSVFVGERIAHEDVVLDDEGENW